LETSPDRRVIELKSVVLPALVFPISPIRIGTLRARRPTSNKNDCGVQHHGDGADRHALWASYQKTAAESMTAPTNHSKMGTTWK
jgi:hypothetical protein